jgi:cytochrome c
VKIISFGVLVASTMLATSFFSKSHSQQNSIGAIEGGRALYEAKCGGCHSIDANRIGPLHRGIKNRKIGSILDFDYSSALKTAGDIKGLRWNAQSLDQWLNDPEQFLPGQAMNYSLNDPAQRKLIIEYLLSL